MCIRRVQIVRRYNFTSLGIKMYTLEDQGLGLYNATSLENSSVFYYLNVVLFFSLLSIPLLDKINVSILILTGCFKQLQRLTITPILQGSVIFYHLLRQSTKTAIYIHPNTWIPRLFLLFPFYLTSSIYLFSLVSPSYYYTIALSSIFLSLFSFDLLILLLLELPRRCRCNEIYISHEQRWMDEEMSLQLSLSTSTSSYCGPRQMKEQANIINLGEDSPPYHRGMLLSSISTLLCYRSRHMKEYTRMVNLWRCLPLQC